MTKAEKAKRTRGPARESRPNDLGIRIPIDSASWSIGKDVSGSWERCRWYANGVAIDRWAIDELPPSLDLIATRWGRGRFRISFLDAAGQAKGVSRPCTIDDPKYPVGSTYPNKPANGANGSNGAHAPANDQEAKLLAIAEGKLDPASTILTIFSLLNVDSKQRADDAERRARQEIEHVRERARIEREEDERRWERQRAEDEARAKRRLDEEAAAFDRERKRAAEANGGGAAAPELALLKAKLEALEGANGGEDKPSFWEEKLGGLIEQIEPGDVQRVTSAIWDALGDAAIKKKQAKGATP